MSREIKENDIVKIALVDDKVIGFLHFKQIGNLIDCYHALIQRDYRNKGIATKMMENAIEEAKHRDVKTLIVHAVEHDGVVNARRQLENCGFKEIYSVENYWEALYPGEYCKQCKSNKRHCGVVVMIKHLLLEFSSIFILSNINKNICLLFAVYLYIITL